METIEGEKSRTWLCRGHLKRKIEYLLTAENKCNINNYIKLKTEKKNTEKSNGTF